MHGPWLALAGAVGDGQRADMPRGRGVVDVRQPVDEGARGGQREGWMRGGPSRLRSALRLFTLEDWDV